MKVSAYEVLVETEAILVGKRLSTTYLSDDVVPTYWIQDAMRDHKGGFCLMGALQEATFRLTGVDLADPEALFYLRWATGYSQIPVYNDAKWRMHSDIVRALHVAQAQARQDELERIPVLAEEPEERTLVQV